MAVNGWLKPTRLNAPARAFPALQATAVCAAVLVLAGCVGDLQEGAREVPHAEACRITRDEPLLTEASTEDAAPFFKFYVQNSHRTNTTVCIHLNEQLVGGVTVEPDSERYLEPFEFRLDVERVNVTAVDTVYGLLGQWGGDPTPENHFVIVVTDGGQSGPRMRVLHHRGEPAFA